MTSFLSVFEAQQSLADGGVLAYPTEAVYGLGCHAYNEHAFLKLLALKQRRIEKGVIILIHDWAQLGPLIAEVPESCMLKVKETWPGPVTWVFPKSSQVPDYLSGTHSSIAIRMSQHPVASALCKEFPIVSTSANIASFPPARDVATLLTQFDPEALDGIVEGSLGGALQPTMIFDVLSGQQLR